MMRLIDADALMVAIGCVDATKYGNKTAEQQHNSYSTMMLYEIADIVMDAPAVDAEPVRYGEWEYVRTDKYNGEFAVVKCSSCGHTNYAIAEYIRKGIWCPYCGAKMRGDKDATD